MTIDISGKLIHYNITGSGKPVMLVHGFGETSDVWKHQVEFLKDKYKLIIPDLPGSAKSDIIDDMSMVGMAEVMKKILDHEKIEKCTMIGHSMGGYITLAFAKKYPKQLNAFGLFHSTAYADSEEKKQTRQKGIEFIHEYGGFEFLKTATPKLFSDKTRAERPELIDEQIGGLRNFSDDVLVLYYQAMMKRPDTTDALTQSTVPVLFIMGKHDTAIPLEDMLLLCHLPGKSYIHILHDSGHMGMLEEADSSNRFLAGFLADI
jgi:pimeloyl-ACP methyl ester carboxylesterase